MSAGQAPESTYVMKFGGSSLTGSKEVLQSISIVERYVSNSRVVVVCSAMGDTTDYLLEAVKLAQAGKVQDARRAIAELRSNHEIVVDKTITSDSQRTGTMKFLQERFEELDRALFGISLLRDVSPRSLDYVLSFGERVSTFLVNEVLCSHGVRSKCLTGGEAGIVTDESFGSAEPLFPQTRDNLRAKLLPLLDQKIVPVITGYIAEASDSHAITTLGRGGSDYTASLAAASIGADEVVLWTDVDGILSADPRIVSGARILKGITYLEAMEMSAFGAKSMQPRALEPVARNDVPVRIRNTFRPEGEGTLIGSPDRVANGTSSGVKAVGSVGDVAIVSISGTSIVGHSGTAVKIFDILKELEVSILMISQSVSESNVSLVIRRDVLGRVFRAFRTQLLHEDPSGGGGSPFSKVDCEDDVAIVAVLGRGMIGTPGIAGRVFTTIANQGINVRMIAQGSSEINISFVIKDVDRKKAVVALHDEFRLGEEAAHQERICLSSFQAIQVETEGFRY